MAHGLPDSLKGRDFIRVADLSREELEAVLRLAFEMKREQKQFRIADKTVVMLFFNYSLRTRTSFEIGCRQIGLTPIAIDASSEGWDLEWRDGVRMDGSSAEHVKDAARVLSRYADAIALRSYPPMKNLVEDRADPLVNAFRTYATVPVINLESATAHPCQGLGDLMTLQELFPAGMKGKKVVLTWVPGPQPFTQSVANSFLGVAALTGANVVVAHPEGFDLAPETIQEVTAAAKAAGGRFEVSHDRDAALEGSAVVYAKSWVSSRHYGDWEAEKRLRAQIADKWMVTATALERTHHARFMHPLPLRRNVVATDEVVDGPNCVVYQQAENRLHVQKALLTGLLG